MNIFMNDDQFEYEIRGLLMSFYPGEKFTMVDDRKEAEFSVTCLCEKEAKDEYKNITSRDEIAHPMLLSEDEKVYQVSALGEKVCFSLNLLNRKQAKTKLKDEIYLLLSKVTGKTLPWGTLTGIRPTKIPMAMLEEGKSEDEIRNHMEKELLCSKEKTDLSIQIAKRELELLKHIDYEDGYSLYIGIPFCPTTCLYCSFTSYPIARWRKRMDEYLTALEKEIDYAAEAFQNKKLNTIYFGGGTPTTLEPEELERVFQRIVKKFDLQYLQEWTVEAGRPDSVTAEKLDVLKRYPVSRISINPQTMKQETLKLIGRNHTVEQVKQIFALAREKGFDNINMDLILGLPGETMEDVKHTMEEIVKLNPDNVTIHSLALKRAARLVICKDEYADYKMENTEEMMNLCAGYCKSIGEEPYYLYRQKNMAGNLENVGYARGGKAGIYNILIMEEKQTIVALGAGSTTKAVWPDHIERAENVKDVETYIQNIDEMIQRKKKLFSQRGHR